MKISKSKQELARIIGENGGWCEGAEWAALEQQGGDVWLCALKPSWNVGIGIFSFKDHVKTIPGSYKLPNIHQTILSSTEYFHLYPAPDADGWIEWNGGECPVERGTLVDVKYAAGGENIGVSAITQGWHEDHVKGTNKKCTAANWVDRLPVTGIVAYRPHKPEISPDAQEPNPVPVPEAKPTIEHLASDYRNAKDYAERKQQEADDAKADVRAKLKALELAGEAIGLLVSPITAKQEPELVITNWRDLRVGDVVELISFQGGSAKVGEIGKISKFFGNGGFHVDFPSQSGYSVDHSHIKFIRRP